MRLKHIVKSANTACKPIKEKTITVLVVFSGFKFKRYETICELLAKMNNALINNIKSKSVITFFS